MLLDPGIPKLYPEGHYLFEIVSDPEKKPNSFGKGFYYEFKFVVKDANGEHWNYTGIFAQKQDKYHDLLIALGGTKDEKGYTRLPDISFVGRKFEADIIQRPAKNDPKKMINDIINIIPLRQPALVSQGDISVSQSVEEESKNEEIPF